MRVIAWRFGVVLVAAVGLLALYGWSALRPPASPEPRSTAFTLEDVTLVTPGREHLAGQALGVRDGVIAARGPRGDVAVGEALPDYSGAFVLPGLMDLHTHLPSDTPLALAELVGILYLAHGVTTVREAGDLDGTAVDAARRAYQRDGRAGPRLFSSGWFVAGGQPRWAHTIVVRSKRDVREAVARIRSDGHDSVKSYEDLSVELIREIETAARAEGLQVIGHVPTPLSYEEARVSDTLHFLGVPLPHNIRRDHVYNRIADWDEVDAARIDAVVAATREHSIANTPTLVMARSILRYADPAGASADPALQLMPRMFRDVAWHPQEGLAVWRNLTREQLERLRAANAKKLVLLRALYEAGSELRIGTDTLQPFVVPGDSVHREMQIFVEAGIPAEAVWEIATWRAGRALGEEPLGTLAVGAPADLLVFERDPTRDLSALDSLTAVVSQGRLYAREDLDASIAAWQRHTEGWLFDTLSVSATRRLLAAAVKRDN